MLGHRTKVVEPVFCLSVIEPNIQFSYLLGDTRGEAARLASQAALWDPVSHALFDRIGVTREWRVLEIGPGAGSLHLELRRRVQGPIDAVEQSAAFCASLAEWCRADGLGAGTIWNQPLLEAALPEGEYDLVFARWVFLFLPDPLRHLQLLARALKPGGVLAIQDYFRDTFCLVPLPGDWPALVAADRAFFAAEGGDANIGARLPELYRRVGIDTIGVHPTIMSGGPGSAVWNWLSGYFLGILDRYASIPPLTPASAARVRDDWQRAQEDPASLLIAPAVLDVVGRKS